MNGEVQIFRQYRRMVSAARRARAEFVARNGFEPADEDLPEIWDEAARLRRCGMPVVPEKGVASVVGA